VLPATALPWQSGRRGLHGWLLEEYWIRNSTRALTIFPPFNTSGQPPVPSRTAVRAASSTSLQGLPPAPPHGTHRLGALPVLSLPFPSPTLPCAAISSSAPRACGKPNLSAYQTAVIWGNEDKKHHSRNWHLNGFHGWVKALHKRNLYRKAKFIVQCTPSCQGPHCHSGHGNTAGSAPTSSNALTPTHMLAHLTPPPYSPFARPGALPARPSFPHLLPTALRNT